MSGFDSAALDAEFFPDGRWKSNLLVNLGYGRSEAFAAVMSAGKELGSATGVSALIRHALKALGSER